MEEILAYFLSYRFFFYITIVTLFLGLQLFQKLPQYFYGPALSILNVASCIFLVLEIQFLGNADENDTTSILLGFFSILLLTTNLVGGFLFVDKQVKVFKNFKK